MLATSVQEKRDNDIYLGMLVRRRLDLLSSLRRQFREDGKPETVAEDDQAILSHDEYISLSLSHMAIDELREVEEALSRIDSGDYGYCLDCGQAIPEKRLRYVPWARYCIRCKERRTSQPPEDSGEAEVLFRLPARKV